MMSSADRRTPTGAMKKPTPQEAVETTSIIFEWPLRGLKQMFESTKSDTKSKVIKSATFGGGRWTILFYAQSGHEQFCSLYLNAEPLPHERVNPLLRGSPSPPGTVAARRKEDEKWERDGLFHFTFTIEAMESKEKLGSKDAHDHAFSFQTSNWGWAQFAKREAVYYKKPEVMNDDAFLITVQISGAPDKPKLAPPITHEVPPVLIQAMGSLLDDSEHSDVVFYLHPKRRSMRSKASEPPQVKKVYAIRKILAARSEYFRDMFEGGFSEAEAECSSGEENRLAIGRRSGAVPVNDKAHPQGGSPYGFAQIEMQGQGSPSESESPASELEDDELYAHEAILEDSDEEIEELEAVQPEFVPVAKSRFAGSRALQLEEEAYAGSREEAHTKKAHAEQDSSSVASEEQQEIVPQDEDEKDDSASSSKEEENEEDDDAEDGEAIAPSSADEAIAPKKNFDLLATTPSEARSKGKKEARNDGRDRVEDQGGKAFPSSNLVGQLSPAKSVTSKRSNAKLSGTFAEGDQTFSSGQKNRRKRRKVDVRDSAYPTFKALLFFLYTDTIDFAPLTSHFIPDDLTRDPRSASGLKIKPNFEAHLVTAHKKRKAAIEAYVKRNPHRPYPCSAKAMYKLADKLQIPDLKKRAQEHIEKSLSISNIVWEAFSGFNRQFHDIRKMESDYLLNNWAKVKTTQALKTVFERPSAHPGLGEVWPHLLDRLEYRDTSTAEGDDDT